MCVNKLVDALHQYHLPNAGADSESSGPDPARIQALTTEGGKRTPQAGGVRSRRRFCLL